MMAETNATPLWLDLRKEYIDDNFDKLLIYLKECSHKNRQDAFYNVTLNLLRSRITELVQKESSKPLFNDPDDKETVTFRARLLAAYLLLEDGTPLALSAYIALMDALRILDPKSTDNIVKTTIKRLKYKNAGKLDYSWKDLIDFKVGIFTYRLIANSKFTLPLDAPLKYEHCGSACLTDKGLFLSNAPLKESTKLLKTGYCSLDTKMGVTLLTASTEKLKQSLETNLPAMDEFVKDFIVKMSTVVESPARHLLTYDSGDEVTLVVTEIDRLGYIHAETTASNYNKLRGIISFTHPNVLYYSVSLFTKYIKPGDYILATVKSTAPVMFDIEKSFIRFVVEGCRNDIGTGLVCAKLLYKNQRSLVWMDNYGTPFYSKMDDSCEINDYATLKITEYQKGDRYGMILTEIVEKLDEESIDNEEKIDTAKAQKETINDFVESTPVTQMQNEEDNNLPEIILPLLTRMFFEYQKTLLKPSERYVFLGNATVMAEMTGDTLAASYIRFASTYLRVLVQFASNESISNITLKPDKEFEDATETRLRLSILELLKEYGKKENSDKLACSIAEYEKTQPILARLARLIQTANSMQGILSGATINVIKREIIRTLSLETAEDTDLETEGGTYLGIESGTQEFKSSFVYPPNNNMQPNATEQEKNVFKSICAFLNSSTGGTLYLGVNDQGYVTGLENDFSFLKISSVDAYIRHIQDRAKMAFDTDGIVYLKIEPMYENRVVAIHVEPHPYRVVELNNIAYIRVNNESREMSEKLKQEMLAKKVFTDKDKAATISRLQHACSKNRTVVLHKYSSSNSLSISDRTVEPYDVRPGDNLVIGYDCQNRKCKVFNLNRIGYVEVLNEGWQHTVSHERISVDAFHMSGSNAIEVSLQLDLMAKNLLMEEYPATKDDIVADKKDTTIWYYSGKVYSLAPVARFYMGLASHITILNCQELREYVRSYIAENFAEYMHH